MLWICRGHLLGGACARRCMFSTGGIDHNNHRQSDEELQDVIEQEEEVELVVLDKGNTRRGGAFFKHLNNTISQGVRRTQFVKAFAIDPCRREQQHGLGARWLHSRFSQVRVLALITDPGALNYCMIMSLDKYWLTLDLQCICIWDFIPWTSFGVNRKYANWLQPWVRKVRSTAQWQWHSDSTGESNGNGKK